MSHCESSSSRCTINKAEDFNLFLDKLSGGFLGVEEKIRPDHTHNPSVQIKDAETDSVQWYTPPAASYLQFTATKPVDLKCAKKAIINVSGGGNMNNVNEQRR